MSYKKRWWSWDFNYFNYKSFNITDSYRFLEKNLKIAKSENKRIIINVHDIGNTTKDPRFLDLLKKYKVSAVFAGHYHSLIGEDGNFTFKNALGANQDIPVFFSGSSAFNNFLSVRFLPNDMIVYKQFRN